MKKELKNSLLIVFNVALFVTLIIGVPVYKYKVCKSNNLSTMYCLLHN